MKMRIRRGFTLAEILISVAILGVVMGAVLTLFYSVFESYQFHQDITEAKQNGQNALAAIQPYISAAALGIPNNATAFNNAFSQHDGIKKKAAALLPGESDNDKRFKTTVQIASAGKAVTPPSAEDDYSGNELWLVYAVPSGTGVEKEFEVSPGGSEVELKDLLNAAPFSNHLVINSASVKSWVAFPGSSYPMYVSEMAAGNARKITLAAHNPQKISAFDEMHYVRAVKIKIEDNTMKIAHLLDDPDLAGSPTVEGISDALFEFGPDRVLKVTFLARGSTKHNKEYMTDIPGWEGPMPDDMHYRYATVSRSWRIRN